MTDALASAAARTSPAGHDAAGLPAASNAPPAIVSDGRHGCTAACRLAASLLLPTEPLFSRRRIYVAMLHAGCGRPEAPGERVAPVAEDRAAAVGRGGHSAILSTPSAAGECQ